LAEQLVRDLIDSGIHFGHRASRWNPKMKPYIFGKRNLIHIIDVKETLKGILLAKRFLSQLVASGKDVLFVGTKRQARKAIQEQASAVGMHYVNDRWLGGTLTNFREIRKRVGRLDHLEQLEAEGQLDTYSKKEGSAFRREIRKIRRNLGGIRKMSQMPGVLVIIDPRREINAVREARNVGIPVICLIDTDCDPDLVDIPIPGNDDAMRAIEIVVTELAQAVASAFGARQKAAEAAEQPATAHRRSRRATARAEEEAAHAKVGEETPASQDTSAPIGPQT
jgi:small subunit ribosomal protein S2